MPLVQRTPSPFLLSQRLIFLIHPFDLKDPLKNLFWACLWLMFVMFISAVHWHCLTVTSLGVKMKLIDDNFGCILMKGQQWCWLVWVFFPLLFLHCRHNCHYDHFQQLYSLIMWCFLCIRNFSHMHWGPGVSLQALSTLLCWVLYFVYCLASTPIAVKLNPISGSTISES